MDLNAEWNLQQQITANRVQILETLNFENSGPVKVSIIIPVYNVEKTLRECIDSVISQSLKEIEIICVNDGSKDSSLEIIKEYAAIDPRVKIINKQNAGYGHSVNIGMDYSSGEYIGIVESDDYVHKDMFYELYVYSKMYNTDFTKSDYSRFVTKNGVKEFTRIKVAWKDYYYRVIDPHQEPEICKFNMQTWCGIYKKNFLSSNNIRHNETPGASFQDNGFYLKTYSLANRVAFIDKPSYYYRFDNPYSSVHDRGKVFVIKDEYDLVEKYYKDLKIYEDVKDLFIWKKFNSFIFTIERIDDIYRKEFTTFFSEEFTKYYNDSQLNKNYYSKNEWAILMEIITSPDSYLRRHYKEGVLISIIVPCYNAEAHLEECINSILCQTLKEIEIICVDDGSKDSTPKIIEQLSNKDERIIPLYFNNNRGVSTARNQAMKLSKGKYIAFMDSDDYYPSQDILETLYHLAIDNNVLVCGGSFSETDGVGVFTDYKGSMSGYKFKKNGLLKYSDYQFDFGFHRFIYNRDMLLENSIVFPPYIRYQDPPFFVRALSCANLFYTTTKVVYCYRRNHDVKWTEAKVISLNEGLLDVLSFSIENNYEELYHLCINRFENKYWKPNIQVFNYNNKKLLMSLTNINDCLNMNNYDQRDFIWAVLMRKMKLAIKSDAKNIEYSKNDDYYIICKNITSSFSYRLGRALTYLPRKVLRIIQK